MHSQQPPFVTTAIIYVIAIALFVWRMARPQRMSVTRLMLMPIVLLALTGFSIYANVYASLLTGQIPPPAWQVALVLVVGAILGIPLGLFRGRHSEVKPTERAGVMYVHSSPLIIVIWIAAFVARAALRALLPQAQTGAALGGDGLLAFAMAALVASYYSIYMKYRSLTRSGTAAVSAAPSGR
jgi:uncharacterized membrane protein